MADKSLFRIFVLIACCALIAAARRVSFLDPEAKLRANLTSRYALYPRIQRRAPIHVGFTTVHGISLDSRLEVFSLIAVLNLKWTIEELKWQPTLYNGIQSIIMPAVFVWKPLIYLSNRAKLPKMLDTSEISRGIVFISHEGVVEWKTRAVLFVHCAVHLRNFPFDQHECQIRLQNPPDAKQILYPLTEGDSYVENANSEWHVRSTGVRAADFRLIFSFHFQRVSNYYVVALATPILVSSISTLLMFWLPPASGEKIILGSIATSLQLLLTGHVIWLAPHNAGPVPIIILLLAVCLFFSSLSLLTSASLLAFTWRRLVSPSRSYAVPVPGWFSRILCLPESPALNVNVRYVVGERGPAVTMETPPGDERGNIPAWLLWCFVLDRVFFILFLAFYLFLFISLLK